jgi:hypothetical protein
MARQLPASLLRMATPLALRVPEGGWTSLRSPGHAMHWLDTYNTYPRSLPGGNLVPAAHGRSIDCHYYYIPTYL